jgi:hypothetical protein
MDRADIHDQFQQRLDSRTKLLTDIDQAKQDLHPKALATRWKTKQKAKIVNSTAQAGQLVRKNAFLIAALGVGALLFAARRPISAATARLTTKTRKSKPAPKVKE